MTTFRSDDHDLIPAIGCPSIRRFVMVNGVVALLAGLHGGSRVMPCARCGTPLYVDPEGARMKDEARAFVICDECVVALHRQGAVDAIVAIEDEVDTLREGLDADDRVRLALELKSLDIEVMTRDEAWRSLRGIAGGDA